jgi:hypothetical protein
MTRCLTFIVLIPLVVTGAAPGQTPILSTWFGGPGEDKLTAAAVLKDGSFLLGGVEAAGDQKVQTVRGSGTGVLVHLSPAADKVLGIQRLKGPVGDMDVGPAGNVYAVGGFGLVKLGPTGRTVLFRCATGGAGARVAAGPNGSAVVLHSKSVTVVDGRGRRSGTWGVPGDYVEDVACDIRNGLVFVTGFDNKRGHKEPVQVAFVYAYDGAGRKGWKAYAWGGVEVDDQGLMADTRGYRLAMGADGKLYVAGESAGGNTMWSRRAQNLKEKAGLYKGDKYQHAYNTASNHITYIGRLDPKTGKSLGGTMLLARVASSKGNTIRPRALAVDAAGTIYAGGMSASGAPVSEGAFGGQFDGGGAFFCIFDSTFKRLYATKFCSGTTAAVAVGRSTIVAAGEGKQNLTPLNAFREEPGGKTDGWAVVFTQSGAPPPPKATDETPKADPKPGLPVPLR